MSIVYAVYESMNFLLSLMPECWMHFSDVNSPLGLFAAFGSAPSEHVPGFSAAVLKSSQIC